MLLVVPSVPGSGSMVATQYMSIWTYGKDKKVRLGVSLMRFRRISASDDRATESANLLISPSTGLRRDLKLKGSAHVSKEKAKELLLSFDGCCDGTVLLLDVAMGVKGHFTRDMIENLVLTLDGWADAGTLELEIREFGVWIVVPTGLAAPQRIFIGEAQMVAQELGRMH